MRESDIPRFADILVHLTNHNAIMRLLAIAEELHYREELAAIKETIEEEKVKAAKMQAVLTAERDEALRQVQALKKQLADMPCVDAVPNETQQPSSNGWIPNTGKPPNLPGPLWVKFDDGEVRRASTVNDVSWSIWELMGGDVTHYRTTPPPDEDTD